MEPMEFSIKIEASKQDVWRTLWSDKTFRQWAGLIDPGTYLKGELKEGRQVQFISAENGYGVTSLVEAVVPYEHLVLRHQADTQEAGAQQRDKEWTGGQESYRLSETKAGATLLSVAFDVPAHMKDYFSENYPLALQKVKELAELRS